MLARGDDPTLLERAAEALSESGGRFEVRCSYGAVTSPSRSRTRSTRSGSPTSACTPTSAAAARSSDEAVHQVLLRVAAEHDGELHEHVEDVADLVGAVGRELGLDEAALLEVRRAAALHDIGKVAIPDAILHAPRKLTEDEWEYMRQHTIIGERIIRAAPDARRRRGDRPLQPRALGRRRLPGPARGEDIPLGARIVAVCDSYDAIVTDRAYRTARSRREAALAELRAAPGTQFDPEVVAAFALALEREATVTV